MTESAANPAKDQAVKGPASYFPSIERQYGRPISDWISLIQSRTELKHMALVAWLKAEYGLGHGHANALVAHTLALAAAPNSKPETRVSVHKGVQQ